MRLVHCQAYIETLTLESFQTLYVSHRSNEASVFVLTTLSSCLLADHQNMDEKWAIKSVLLHVRD